MFRVDTKTTFNYRFSDPICTKYYSGNIGIYLELMYEQKGLLYNVAISLMSLTNKLTNIVDVTVLDGKSCHTVAKCKGAWTRIVSDKEIEYGKYPGPISKFATYLISFYDAYNRVQKFCLLKFPVETYMGNNIKGSGFDYVNTYLVVAEVPLSIPETKSNTTSEDTTMAKKTTATVKLVSSALSGIVKALVVNAKGVKVTKKGHYSFYLTVGEEVISGRFSKDGAYDCKRGDAEMKIEMVHSTMMADHAFGLLAPDGVVICIAKWDEAKVVEFKFGDKTFKGWPADGQQVTVSVELPKVKEEKPATEGKRGPGRPKKVAAPPVVDDDDEAGDDDGDEAETTAATDDDGDEAGDDDGDEAGDTTGGDPDDDEAEGAADDDGDEATEGGDDDDEGEAAADDDGEEAAEGGDDEEAEEPPTGPAWDEVVKKFKKDTKVEGGKCFLYFDGEGGVEKIKMKSFDAKNKTIEVYIISSKEKATITMGEATWLCLLLNKPE
jgi:hypothetical protein